MQTLFTMILVAVVTVLNLIAPQDQTSLTDMFLQAYTDTMSGGPVRENSTAVIPDIQATAVSPSADAALIENPHTEPTPLPVIPTASALDMLQTNPKILFGNPQTEDNFERGSTGFGINAGLNDDEGIRIIALNNRISLEPKKNNGWLSWRLRPPALSEGAAEMEFSILTCARGDRTGLVMHAPDYTGGHGYYFSLACEGTVSILRDAEVLGTADAASLFKNSSGDVNTMTAIIRGNSLSLILNGQDALTVQDSTYPQGYSGFFTAPQNQDTLTLDIMTFRSFSPQQ